MNKENIDLTNQATLGTRGGRFNSLLLEASKDVNTSLNEKAALTVKSREERLIRKEREEDEEEAKKLQQEYEDEYVTWIIQDQEEKLQLYREEVSKEREEQDRQLCHRLIMEEEEALYAKKVREEEDFKFAEHVQTIVERELEEEERKERMLKADAKLAKELARQWVKEEEREKQRNEASDRAVAKSLAKQEQRSFHRTKVTENRKRRRQVEEDAKVAYRIAEGKEEAFEEKEGKDEKARPSLREFKRWCEDLEEQWEDPDLQVDNVHSGLCLILHLPYLLDIRLGTKGKHNDIVCVSAKRMKHQELVSPFFKGRLMGKQTSWEESVFEKKHQTFQAEFSFANMLSTSAEKEKGSTSFSLSKAFRSLRSGSSKLSIEPQDMSYEYSSSTGDLFIYIENIALYDTEEEKECDEVEDEKEREGVEEEKECSSSGSKKKAFSSSLFTSFRKVMGFQER